MSRGRAAHLRRVLGLLADIVIEQSREKEIQAIADGLSADKRKPAKVFLAAHPHIHLHLIATYSPWLEQVALGIGRIGRNVISRGAFTYTFDF